MRKFQSTRPARGATHPRQAPSTDARISIHAPREGRDCEADLPQPRPQSISIHAPREGRDLLWVYRSRFILISIHAPREGRDGASVGSISSHQYFNPRAPRGARHSLNCKLIPSQKFQSTRPARGATCDSWLLISERQRDFNPRAPRGARPLRLPLSVGLL